MKTTLLIILLGTTLLACNSSQNNGDSKNNTPNYAVKHFGALKNMMHKGDLSAKVKLVDFEKNKHLYAIGACENLKGEIQIINSESFNTFVKNDTLIFDKTFDKNAALFVYSEVEKWNSFDIPSNIKSYDQLEEYIEELAQENNINTDEPFPFLIEGKVASFDWHVINWKDGDTEHTHEKHVTSGLHGTIEDAAIELLGFYSNAHHTIFTHHTTNMHVHVVTKDRTIAGHLDDVTLSIGMKIKLPAID